MSALDDVLAAVAAAMHESMARWYLFGAQAATLWGRPRLTADVDVTAEIPFERLDSFLEAMKRQGFTLRVEDREFDGNAAEGGGATSLSRPRYIFAGRKSMWRRRPRRRSRGVEPRRLTRPANRRARAT